MNGEVVADRASEGLSEERVEIGPLREATVCVTGLSGLDREAFVPEREVDVVEVAVGVFERRDVCDPQLLDQAVLRSAEVTLDATLGLGRVCEDQLDVELTQGLANNGLGTLGVALFERDGRDRPGPLAKVARLVGVEGDGTAMAAQVVDGDLPVGCSRVAWDETGHHELVRGIVMHLNEHEAASSAVLEPGVLGAVPLDELAEGRPARSGLAMPRPPALRLPGTLLDHPLAQGAGLQRPDLSVA